MIITIEIVGALISLLCLAEIAYKLVTRYTCKHDYQKRYFYSWKKEKYIYSHSECTKCYKTKL
jgi:hypothetical protein